MKKIAIVIGVLFVIFVGFSSAYADFTIIPNLNLIKVFPNAPSDLTVQITYDPNNPSLNKGLVAGWTDNSTNEDGFVLQRKLSGIRGDFQDIATTQASFANDDNVVGGKTYIYRVKAFNAFGDSAFSNEFTIKFPAVVLETAAPTDLTVTLVDGTFLLYWVNHGADTEYYNIERSENGLPFIALTYNFIARYTDATVKPGVQYIYRVNAHGPNGDSAYSNEVSTQFQYISPSSPTGLTANQSAGIVSLGWSDNSNNEDGFTLERKEEGGAYKFLNGTSAGMTSLVDNSVVAGKTYIYRVKAISTKLGDSAYSNEVTVAIPATGPIAPSKLIAGVSAGIVSLGWSDNSNNEDGFTLERKEEGGAYKFLNGTSAGMTSLVDNSVVAGKTYIYRVKAISTKLGDSAYSNEVTVAIPSTGPIAPSKLIAGVSAGIVSLGWSDNSNNEDGFTLERKEEGGAYKFLNGTSAGMTSLVDNSVVAGKTYIYRVKAISTKLGDSAYSNEVTVAIPATGPIAPSKLIAGVSAGIVSLGWSDNSNNEDGFTLERKEEGGTFKFLNGTSAGMTSLVDNSVVAGKTYIYRVKAISTKLGDSLYSNEATVVVPSIAPIAPSKLSAGQSAGIVSLSWSDNSTNEDGFILERKEAGGAFKFLNGTSSGMTSLVDNSVVLGKTYTYRVKAISTKLGDSLYSNEVTLIIGQANTVVDFSSASSWAVVEIQKAMDYKLTTDKVLSGFNEKITREAFCEVAVKLYEAISGKTADAAVNPFTDTSNSEILKAYQLGIVKGITASNFKPSNSITRQEICVMMLRTLKAALPNGDYNPSGAAVLADEKKIASWALDAVKYMNKNGIMNGTGGNNISPEGNTTKEQAIALIKRLFEKYQ